MKAALLLLLRRLFVRRPPPQRPRPPHDPERLQRVYRETQRQVEKLRKAA